MTVNTTPMLEQASIRPSRRTSSISTAASTAAAVAPTIIGSGLRVQTTLKTTALTGRDGGAHAASIRLWRRSPGRFPGTEQDTTDDVQVAATEKAQCRESNE